MKSRAQVSMEYLIILGISLAILIPASYFFYTYSRSSGEVSVRAQVSDLGNTILSFADSVYGLSEPTLTTQTLTYPSSVRDIYILNSNELVISYELSTGINELVFFSKVPLSGNYIYPGNEPRSACASYPCSNSTFTSFLPKPGRHSLKLESKTKYVLITQVT